MKNEKNEKNKKVIVCKSAEEAKELAEKEGVALTDEDLEKITAGSGFTNRLIILVLATNAPDSTSSDICPPTTPQNNENMKSPW